MPEQNVSELAIEWSRYQWPLCWNFSRVAFHKEFPL